MKKRLNCIMLIDDDEDDNYFHQIILRKMDIAHHIEVAESGLEALDYLEKGNEVPDIIFLDINMPGMDGWDFLDEYKKLNAREKTTVIIIMLTTSISPADKEKAEKMPEITSFQSKPMTQEMLNDILERYFSDHKNESV
jgi:CheY-like chemotaxis protein